MKRAQTTREQILEYLGAHSIATATELAMALGVTPANIRHHLGLLQAQGVVERANTQQTAQRGRPAYLYRLTRQAHQAYLEPLTRALLDTLRAWARQQNNGDSHFSPEALLCEALCASCTVEEDQPLRARLGKAIQWLQERHFDPHWEAHRFGPRVIFRRCPYASLVQDYPELCRLDELMLERLLAARVHRLGERDASCEFAVLSLPPQHQHKS